MVQPAAFRCPFEVQAAKEGKILKVELGTDRVQRINLLQSSFAQFHNRIDLVGIGFFLDDTSWEGCLSNKELKERIVPFQSELVAAELEYRLYPYMPYQITKIVDSEAKDTYLLDAMRPLAAVALGAAIEADSGRLPHNSLEVAGWIEHKLRSAPTLTGKGPRIKIFGRMSLLDPNAPTQHFITIYPSSAVIHFDRVMGLRDPALNKNSFVMVKSPFYPKPFGRYSPRVELVVTRESHFVALPKDQRTKIRIQSNAVLRSHGVDIRLNDLDHGKQGSGVWLPTYRRRG